MTSPKDKKLNLGCGTVFRNDWTNVDLISNSPDVIAHDLKSGIPFATASFEAVYHSHVLEHLSPDDGKTFVRECARVLKPGGILRIAVPNLESIARVYLEKLAGAMEGKEGAELEYRWIVIELLDQIVRDKSGGRMAEILSKPNLPELPFILNRIGDEGLYLRELLLGPVTRSPPQPLFVRLIGSLRSGRLGSGIRSRIIELFLRLVGGRNALETWRRGAFRASGEIHQWMYDRFSLGRMLEECGFVRVAVRAAEESQIEGFPGSGLEVAAGKPRKPDSLYIEGVRAPD